MNLKFFSSVWPFELKEYIQEKKEKGGIVSERLVMLSDSLDEEQNPVLVIANLKNRWIWNFYAHEIDTGCYGIGLHGL